MKLTFIDHDPADHVLQWHTSKQSGQQLQKISPTTSLSIALEL
jgi:hypothetical protein